MANIVVIPKVIFDYCLETRYLLPVVNKMHNILPKLNS